MMSREILRSKRKIGADRRRTRAAKPDAMTPWLYILEIFSIAVLQRYHASASPGCLHLELVTYPSRHLSK
jgi:hypothetical protein